jgi:kumamolisin
VKKTFILIFFLMVTLSAAAQARQHLTVPHLPATAFQSPIGPLDPNKHLHLAVGLVLPAQAQLNQFLKGLYDPQSPDYQHYLTPAEFTQRFGPSEADYEAVVAFFEKQGFKVTTWKNRTLVDIDGTVQQVEETFHITLRLYKHPLESRNFYAPDKDPWVDLDIPLSNVSGLEDYSKFRPAMAHHALSSL